MGKLIKKTKDWAVQLDKEQTLQLHNLNVIFRNNGFDADQEHVGMTDALDVPNAAMLIPRVLTQFVQEGVEPLLIGRNLLQRIEYVPGMQTVFPAIDQLQAREVGDGMSLPIFNISMGGGQTYGVSVKRHGLMLIRWTMAPHFHASAAVSSSEPVSAIMIRSASLADSQNRPTNLASFLDMA